MSQKIKHIKLALSMITLIQVTAIKSILSNKLRPTLSEIYVRFIDAEKPVKIAQEHLIQVLQYLNIVFLVLLIGVILFYLEYDNKIIKVSIAVYSLLITIWYFTITFLV